MKALLGILLLVNAALLMWNLGQREFMHDEHAPATEFHPELMILLPAETSPSMAKITINSSVSAIPGKQPEVNVEAAQMQPAKIGNTLLEDTGSASATTEIIKPVSEEAVPLAELIPGQCMFIGPYLTDIDRGRAGRQLQDMKINFTESENSQASVLGHRVYQGPFTTSEDISRARRRLEKQGVKDLYLMNEEADRKYISLGFFSNEKSAAEFMRQISKLKVSSKQRVEYAVHYWLSVSDVKSIEKLRERNAMPLPPGIGKSIRACSDQPK